MEYEYALKADIPVLGFIRRDLSSLPHNKVDNLPQLRRFIKIVKQKEVKYWSNPHELAGAVSRAMHHVMEDSPRMGWVRDVNKSYDVDIMNIVKRILDDRPNAQNVALRKSLSHIDKSTELKPTSDGIPQMYQQNLPQMQTSLFSDIELTSQVNDGVPIIKYTNNFCLDPKKRYALLEVTNIVLSSGITAFSNMLGHLMSAGSPRYSFWQNCDLLHEKISDSSCTNVFLTFGVNIFLDAL